MPLPAPILKVRAGRKVVFRKEECLRKASLRGHSVAGGIRLRQKCLRKASSRGNSVAGGNSAVCHQKTLFGCAHKSATRNAGTMS